LLKSDTARETDDDLGWMITENGWGHACTAAVLPVLRSVSNYVPGRLGVHKRMRLT